MATKEEGIQRHMVVKRIGVARCNSKSTEQLNDIQETSNLAENLKQAFYQAYKEAYNDDAIFS